MTGLSVIESRRAGRDEPDCPRCGRPVERGQRIVFVRDDQLGHVWIHVRHLAEALAQGTDKPEDATS
jgi:hypothetical protein